MSDIPLTAAWVAEVMAGTLAAGGRGVEFAGVSIDTRTLATNELFIAIRGEHFDGTSFAETAIEHGAAGVVVPRGGRQWSAMALAERPAVIEVDDTVVALQALAQAIRRASGAKVVAITGSAGKTTTKEVTAELLGAQYHVVRNKGEFQQSHRAAVVADRIAPAAGHGSRRARNESRRRNQHAGASGRTGRTGVDQCRRSARRLFRIDGRHRRRESGDSRAGDTRDRFSLRTRTIRGSQRESRRFRAGCGRSASSATPTCARPR
jgi:hypothetical protein